MRLIMEVEGYDEKILRAIAEIVEKTIEMRHDVEAPTVERAEILHNGSRIILGMGKQNPALTSAGHGPFQTEGGSTRW